MVVPVLLNLLRYLLMLLRVRRGGAENVDDNFHSPTDTNVPIVGSHVWVHVLQLPRAGQATHTPAYFRWTRTLAIVGKHSTTPLEMKTKRLSPAAPCMCFLALMPGHQRSAKIADTSCDLPHIKYSCGKIYFSDVRPSA